MIIKPSASIRQNYNEIRTTALQVVSLNRHVHMTN